MQSDTTWNAPNPFAGYGARVSGSRLVGREQQALQLIRNLAHGGGSSSVIGDGRIGKSSLLSEVQTRLTRMRPELPIAEVSVSECESPAQFFNEIGEQLQIGLRRTGIERPAYRFDESNAYEAFRSLKNFLDAFHSDLPDRHFVLVLDEFDYVRSLEGGPEVVRKLRELANNPRRFGLSCAIVSRRPLAMIETRLTGVSTLAEMCHIEYVRPLASDGTDALIARGESHWTPGGDERRAIHAFCGGHPFLAEVLMYHACEVGNYRAGFQRAASAAWVHYEHLREALGDEFEQLLQVTVGPRWNVRVGCIDRLRLYGVVREADREARAEYVGWSEHFQAYLEHCSREATSWELWRDAERALRDCIEDTLSKALGVDWLAKLRSRNPTIEENLKVAEERRTREAAHFPLAVSIRLLDYTYPKDLIAIISREWGHFSPAFGRDKKYWNDRLDLLAKVRSPDAHHRDCVVSDVDRSLAQGYCKELLEVLVSSRTSRVSEAME